MREDRGMIYLYTGEGAGKTVSALGLALRCLGHGSKVVIIQFLKWWQNTGEYKFKKLMPEKYEIYQFGRKGWIGLKNLGAEDKQLCQRALDLAKKKAQGKPKLLVLDEVNLALDCNLLDMKELIEFLKTIPKETNVVLTGRCAPRELIDFSDFANEVIEMKQPKETPTTRGIQY